ncbi:MAG: hypothetical protein H7256_05055 [Bdellovibrio sp.]|nr:hypothetical protein [Bdellovibrio sp.]
MSSVSSADFSLGLEAGWMSGASSIATGTRVESYFYDANFKVQIPKTHRTKLAVEYVLISTSDKITDTSAVSMELQNFMFGLHQSFLQNDLIAISLLYSPFAVAVSNRTYSNPVTFRGASTLVKIALQPNLTNKIRLIFSMNFFSATYGSNQDSSGTGTVNPGFSKSLLIPSFGVNYDF